MESVSENATLLATTHAPDSEHSGMGTGAVVAIVIVVLLVIIGLAIGGYFGYRKLKERRRSHGEYRPQFEEYQHAKNLPYLQPPAIEGLI